MIDEKILFRLNKIMKYKNVNFFIRNETYFQVYNKINGELEHEGAFYTFEDCINWLFNEIVVKGK